MSDDSKSVEIKITTTADLAGARQTSAALDETTKSTGNLSQKTSDAGKSAEEAGVHFENNRKIFTEIDRIAPGLGESVRAAFEGPLGAVILLGLAVNMVREKLDEYNKELDEVEKAELAAHQETIKRVQKAWDDAATALGEYYAKMAEAGQDNDPEATEIKRIREIQDANIESAKKQIEALGQIEEARLRADGASPEQIAAAKDRTAAQLAALDAQRQAADGSALLQKEQSDRLAKNAALQKAVIETSSIASQADSKFDTDQAKLAKDRALTDATTPAGAEIQKRITAATQNLNAANAEDDYIIQPGVAPIANTHKAADIQAAQDELDKANHELAQARTEQAQLANSEEARANVKKQADDAAMNAKAESLTNEDRLKKLPGEITQAQSLEAARASGDRAASSSNLAKSDVETGEQLAKLAEAGQTSGAQNDRLMQIASQIAGHAVNLATAVEIMENGANNINIFMNQVSRMAAIFSKFDPSQISQMQQDIDAAMRMASQALNNSNLH